MTKVTWVNGMEKAKKSVTCNRVIQEGLKGNLTFQECFKEDDERSLSYLWDSVPDRTNRMRQEHDQQRIAENQYGRD